MLHANGDLISNRLFDIKKISSNTGVMIKLLLFQWSTGIMMVHSDTFSGHEGRAWSSSHKGKVALPTYMALSGAIGEAVRLNSKFFLRFC